MKWFLSPFCLALALGLTCASTVHAEGFSYAEYGRNVRQIVQAITDKCRADGVGSAQDAHQFRKACGLAMRGKTFLGFDDENVFYTRNKTQNGFRDVLGVERRIKATDGKVYSVIRSLNTQITRPHAQPETATSYADATLFVKQEQGEQKSQNWQNVPSGQGGQNGQTGQKNHWQPVWRFVNPHANDWPKKWNRANPLFPAQQNLTPKVAIMIDRLWRETVVQRTAKIALNIKNATGPILQANNLN